MPLTILTHSSALAFRRSVIRFGAIKTQALLDKDLSPVSWVSELVALERLVVSVFAINTPKGTPNLLSRLVEVTHGSSRE